MEIETNQRIYLDTDFLYHMLGDDEVDTVVHNDSLHDRNPEKILHHTFQRECIDRRGKHLLIKK